MEGEKATMVRLRSFSEKTRDTVVGLAFLRKSKTVDNVGMDHMGRPPSSSEW